MVKRRAFLTLILATGLALSARGASAGTIAARPTNRPPILERSQPVLDGSLSSLILYLGDRVTLAYRALRGTGFAAEPIDRNGYHTDGVADGTDGVEPLGAKNAPSGANTAQTRRQ